MFRLALKAALAKSRGELASPGTSQQAPTPNPQQAAKTATTICQETAIH